MLLATPQCAVYTMNVWHKSIHAACALCTDVDSLPCSEMMNNQILHISEVHVI